MNSNKPMASNNNLSKEQKRNRKKSIIIIATLFGFIIGLVALSLVIIGIVSAGDEDSVGSSSTYIFHEADYDFDIMSDPGYIELDRQIYFNNPELGLTVAITKENNPDVPNDQKEYVMLLCDFIEYAIAGKSKELNSLFSQEYIEAGGKTKLDFTMQQLYNIKISYIQNSSEIVEGNTNTSYDYWLEYMIRNNNGTFRSDMESDCIRREYVRVTKRADEIGIDVLAPYTTEENRQEIVSTGEAIKIVLIATVVVAIVCIASVIILKKRK